jgi:hypothetical protein
MIFINNKYTNIYYNIINKAKSRELLEDVYIEKHHIIPKSLGGNNSSANLVKLTGREHFICHMLLPKMTSGTAYKKMIHAAIGMKRSRLYQQRYINSRLYNQIKKEYAILLTLRCIGIPLSAETKAKMSSASKGKKKTAEHAANIAARLKGKLKGPMSEENKAKISNTLKGRPSHKKGKISGPQHTAESKAKIAESNRTRGVSDETKARISAGVKLAQEKRRQLAA